MWAKDVWRVIDLRQRMNFPLRYPDIDPIYNENRYSLYLLIMEALEREEIIAYEFGDRWKNPFQLKMSLDQIYEKIGAFASALAMYSQVLELEPGNNKAQQALDRLGGTP